MASITNVSNALPSLRQFQALSVFGSEWDSLFSFQLEFRRKHRLSAKSLLLMLAMKALTWRSICIPAANEYLTWF